jgi:mevalonate kinase
VRLHSLFAHGKLLLTAEYAVLDGARALALPTRFGQTLEVFSTDTPAVLHWKSVDNGGVVWFSATFQLLDFALLTFDNEAVALRLQSILTQCRAQNPMFAQVENGGLSFTITSSFPLDWGLGSSSTLIALLAKWANINPYLLLENTFGGSGYDIACAFANAPILYQRPASVLDENRFEKVNFNPAFADQLFFVYLGKKQDSRAGIQRYKAIAQERQHLVAAINILTERVLQADTLPLFESILLEHEYLIAQTLDLPRAQEILFPNFPGVIKSLGAWGGDFVLATSPWNAMDTKQWFAQQGFNTCLEYREMI